MSNFILKLSSALIACFVFVNASAQRRDVTVVSGMNVPLEYKESSDMFIGVSYGRFYVNGMGVRTGVQWTQSIAGLYNMIGVPVAFSYTTRSIYPGDSLIPSLDGPRVDQMRRRSSEHRSGVFSDFEFFVGATPGIIADDTSSIGRTARYQDWTERKTPFTLFLDAGMSLNFGIKRVCLKFMPAFHYNLLDSVVYHRDYEEPHADWEVSLRWSYTIGFGLSYRF